MSSSNPPLSKTQIFEGYCPKCHLNRTFHILEGVVGDKDVDYITCICGNKMKVEVLRYLFGTKEYMENQLKYFIC